MKSLVKAQHSFYSVLFLLPFLFHSFDTEKQSISRTSQDVSLFAFDGDQQAITPFVHTVYPTNVSKHITTIDHPSCNNKPGVLVFITRGFGHNESRQAGVWYDNRHWKIYHEDKTEMPQNITYNVFAVNPSSNAFMHKAEKSNIERNWTIIDNPVCNGDPDAVLLVTQNYKGVYNPRPIGVWYTNGKWAIFNQDRSPMPEGVNFNVFVARSGGTSIIKNSNISVHVVNEKNKNTKYPYISSVNNTDKSKILFITQNWKTTGPYNNHIPAVTVRAQNKWLIYNVDKANLPNGAKFNLVFINKPPKTEYTIKQIILRDNGSWLVTYGKNGYYGYQIPQTLLDHLKKLNQEEKDIKHVVLTNNDQWVVINGKNGYGYNGIPDPMGHSIKEAKEYGVEIKNIAMNDNGIYVLPESRWGLLFQMNTPESLLKKLSELKDQGDELKQIILRDDNSWIILHGERSASWNSIPNELADKLKEVYNENREIKNVTCTNNGKWVILSDGNRVIGKGVPDNLKSKISEIAGNGHLFLPADPPVTTDPAPVSAPRPVGPTTPAPNITYKVEIDACHNSLDNEGTGNRITVAFYTGNEIVQKKYKDGVKENCLSSDASWSFTTDKNITHITVSTNGEDGFYIDELRLYENGSLVKHYGRDNGSGWCLSTDPDDGRRSWNGYCVDGVARPSFRFDY